MHAHKDPPIGVTGQRQRQQRQPCLPADRKDPTQASTEIQHRVMHNQVHGPAHGNAKAMLTRPSVSIL